MTLIFGALGLFTTSLAWELKAYEVDSLNVGILIVINTIGGTVGIILSGFVLGKQRQYKRWTIISSFGAAFWLLIQLISLELGSLVLLFVTAGFFGLFLYPFLTLISDFSAEVSFPVGEATATGTLLFGGQIVGFFGAFLIQLLFDGKDKWKTRIGALIIILMLFLGSFVIFWVKEDLRRAKYEREAF